MWDWWHWFGESRDNFEVATLVLSCESLHSTSVMIPGFISHPFLPPSHLSETGRKIWRSGNSTACFTHVVHSFLLLLLTNLLHLIPLPLKGLAGLLAQTDSVCWSSIENPYLFPHVGTHSQHILLFSPRPPIHSRSITSKIHQEQFIINSTRMKQGTSASLCVASISICAIRAAASSASTAQALRCVAAWAATSASLRAATVLAERSQPHCAKNPQSMDSWQINNV